MTTTSGFAPVNGLQMYWESRGEGGVPLIVTHGGFGVTTMFGDLLDRLARGRRVIAVELQGHGHTADVQRPFSFEGFGDDIAALAGHLGLDQVDLLGYSLGASATLRAAIQHPSLVRRMIAVSAPCSRSGWHPEVLEGMAGVNRSGFEMMRQSPMYAAYAAVAPDVDAFPVLMDKTGALLTQPYDWSNDLAALTMPTLLVYADADSVRPAHIVEFYGLLGGGLRDAGWDGSGVTPHKLAVLPDTTHYDIFASPLLETVVEQFLR